MKRRFWCLVIVGTLLAPVVFAQQAEPPAGAAAQAEQPPLTFRVEANFVEVDAFVSDAMGNPVTDLRAADVQLFEDGKPQKVSAFAQVNIPVARAEQPLFSPAAIEPDVQTNAGMDGRIYLFVVDDLHIAPLGAFRVKEALHRFFERNFGANDLAAVVFTSGRGADGQDFTSSPRLLLAAVDKLIGRKLRSPTLERLDEYNRLQTAGVRRAGDPVNDPLGMERGRDARNTMQSLQKLSDFMAGVHGRRKARSQELRAGRRPDGHRGLWPRALCEWDVHLWCLGLTELLDIADIAEDSHDMPLHTRTGRKPAGDSSRQHSIPGFGNDGVHRDTLAHGIPAVQEEPHESFVDYGDTLGIYDVARSFHSRYSAGDVRLSPTIGETLTSWSGSGNGSGASSVAYTMLKMAVFGPMPRASARTAAAESPGAPISPRTANLRSDHSIAISQTHK